MRKMRFLIRPERSRTSEEGNDDPGTEKEAGRIREKGTGADALRFV